MRRGIAITETYARIRALGACGVFDDETTENLLAASELFMRLRFQATVERVFSLEELFAEAKTATFDGLEYVVDRRHKPQHRHQLEELADAGDEGFPADGASPPDSGGRRG